jgi:hypothetical protein
MFIGLYNTSKFAQHISKNHNSFGKTEDIIEILQYIMKRQYMFNIAKLRICKETINNKSVKKQTYQDLRNGTRNNFVTQA